MDEFSQHRGWWGYHRAPPRPLSITQIIRAGTIDAELAALLWLLVEGRVPLVVAASAPLTGRTTILTALLDFLPPDTDRRFLHGDMEDFEWLPDAASLGWVGDHADAPRRAGRPGRFGLRDGPRPSDPSDTSATYLLASELGPHLPVHTWGLQARVAVRALQRGYGLGATIHAGSLEGVFEQLGASPVALTDDELRRLGVVIVLRLIGRDGEALHPREGTPDPEGGSPGGDGSVAAAGSPAAEGQPLEPLEPWVRRRAVAVHYLRPLERDAHGHLQRRPPGVLATWDAERDCFEHFAWGITSELARRVGRSQADFERQQVERARLLARLVESGVDEVPAVRQAIAEYLRIVAARADGPPPH